MINLHRELGDWTHSIYIPDDISLHSSPKNMSIKLMLTAALSLLRINLIARALIY